MGIVSVLEERLCAERMKTVTAYAPHQPSYRLIE